MAETRQSVLATYESKLGLYQTGEYIESDEDLSSSDKEDFQDNPKNLPRIVTTSLVGEDFIGISISPAQVRMRSPQIPAVEKERAIKESDALFQTELPELLQQQDFEADDDIEEPVLTYLDEIDRAQDHPLSPVRALALRPWTQSLEHMQIAEQEDSTRERPASAPPPSLFPAFGFLSNAATDSVSALDSKSTYAPNTKANLSLETSSLVDQRFTSTAPPLNASTIDSSVDDNSTLFSPYTALDGNFESRFPSGWDSNPHPIRRTSTDGSLYVQRTVTGQSSFDDISPYSHLTAMINSRTKAISDSLQNSRLRLARLKKAKILPKMSRNQSQQLEDSAPRQESQPTLVSGNPTEEMHAPISEINKREREFKDGKSASTHPILDKALSRATGDLIVLGGYRGSKLRAVKPPQHRLWAPLRAGFNLRRVNLEVGLTKEDEERMEESVKPAGILSHVGPIDICRKLVKIMKKSPNARANELRVQDFSYDWRLSPDLLSQRLINFLETLPCNHAETPPEQRGATVIAHSLGGLITRHAVNRRPDLFAGVVYCGVPQECANILGPLRNGDEVLMSSRILTAQVNFSMRTSYVFLPEDGRLFFQKHTNQRYDLDYFDLKTWEEFRLSPCISPALTPSAKPVIRRRSIINLISDAVTSSLHVIPIKRTLSSPDQTLKPAEPANIEDRSGENGQEAYNRGIVRTLIEGNIEPSISQPHHKHSIASESTIAVDQAKDYLSRTLKEVLAFKKELHFNPSLQEDNKYPPHALIFGKSVPTVFGVRVADRESIKYTNAFDDLAFAAGDGVVLASAAQLPQGYRCVKNGRVDSDRGHIGLLGDFEGIGRCLNAIFDARGKGVGLGKRSRKSRK